MRVEPRSFVRERERICKNDKWSMQKSGPSNQFCCMFRLSQNDMRLHSFNSLESTTVAVWWWWRCCCSSLLLIDKLREKKRRIMMIMDDGDNGEIAFCSLLRISLSSTVSLFVRFLLLKSQTKNQPWRITVLRVEKVCFFFPAFLVRTHKVLVL